ncbi:MAG: hypothetical protein ACM3II_01920, partial [Rhodospirillaceae bacterium]
MIGKLVQATILVTAGLAISGFSGCTPKTVATKPPAAPDYMVPSPSPPAAATRAICYNEADLSVLRVRMMQQEASVVTLQCQTPSGSRAFDSQYSSMLSKYNADLSANARALNELARRHRFNVDVVVTEFANRTAQKAPVDPQFCARGLRMLEWAIDP